MIIKRFIDKLLSNHPILWNSNIVWVVLFVSIAGLLFFILGYLVTDTGFETYKNHDSMTLLSVTGTIISLLVFIVWVVRLQRYNSFKNFYQRTAISIYGEWILISSICALISFTPFSIYWGEGYRWNKSFSQEKLEKMENILYKVGILVPQNIVQYETNAFDSTQISAEQIKNVLLLNDGTHIIYTSPDFTLKKKYDSLSYKHPSLLYYNPNQHYYEINRNKERQEFMVKEMLINRDEQSIRSLMSQYLNLQEELDVTTNLDVDVWMRYVYNPPFFPITDSSFFSTTSRDNASIRMMKYDDTIEPTKSYYYIPFSELNSYTNFIINKRTDKYNISFMGYLILYLSLFVFCFRMVSGRNFLFGLILMAILLVVSLLSYSHMNNLEIIFIYIVTVFITLSILLQKKYKKKTKKGLSSIYITVWLYILPILLPLTLQVFINPATGSAFEDFTFLNGVFIILLMFPLSYFIREWKALPED